MATGCSSTQLVKITTDGTFSQSQCKEHNPNNQVIMFESKYCSHCQETLPVFLATSREQNITPIILDIAVPEDLKKMQEEYKISIQYTPSFLFGCNYVIGEKNKEQYTQLLTTYKELSGK